MRHFALIAVLLAASACSDDAGDPRSEPGGTDGPCVPRTGSYLVEYDERSGDCGPINSVVSVIKDNAGVSGGPSACGGSQDASANNCEITSALTCDIAPGQTLQLSGKVTWSEDGTRASGRLGAVLYEQNAAVCSSTYDVTWSQQ